MYAKIATNIPPAVATNASEIAGAITENPTFDSLENFANDSKIPTTVPNKPIKGEVEETIDSQDKPSLASFIIDISQACKSGFERDVLAHLLKPDNGLKFDSLEVNVSKDFFSLVINPPYRNINISKCCKMIIVLYLPKFC